MISKHVLFCCILFIVLVAGCGASGVTMDEYPTEGFQTTFSIDYTQYTSTNSVNVSIYMLNPPKTEADFIRIAKQYIGNFLGNEFSDTLGFEFKGRKAAYVEVIGAYGNEVLVMSRKSRDKDASFNKYEPVVGWYNDGEGYGIGTLPSELAQHLIPVTPPSALGTTSTPAISVHMIFEASQEYSALSRSMSFISQ